MLHEQYTGFRRLFLASCKRAGTQLIGPILIKNTNTYIDKTAIILGNKCECKIINISVDGGGVGTM